MTQHNHTSRWLPAPGNIVFTLMVAATILLGQYAAASKPLSAISNSTPETLNYQGYLTDSTNTPLNGTHDLSFTLYDTDIATTPLWGPEQHSDITLEKGLFDVVIGSLSTNGIDGVGSLSGLYLEISVNSETLSPRERVNHNSGQSPSRFITLVKQNRDIVSTTEDEYTFDFGQIEVTEPSTLIVHGLLVLQNNTDLDVSFSYELNGTRKHGGGLVPLAQSGRGYTIANSTIWHNIEPGTHNLSVSIAQPPFRSENEIALLNFSRIDIEIVPNDR